MMTEKQLNNFKNSGLSSDIYTWACDYILDHIDDFEGNSCYACELSDELTMIPNINCIYEEDSIGFIGKHFREAGEVYRYLNNELEMDCNPFEEPEKFVVCWLIHAVECVLSYIPIIEDNWNDEIEITPEVIAEIKEYLYS